jgi:hypothetical protein
MGGVLDVRFRVRVRGRRPFLRAGSRTRTRNWGFFLLILVLWKRRKGKRFLRLCTPKIATCADRLKVSRLRRVEAGLQRLTAAASSERAEFKKKEGVGIKLYGVHS